MVRPSYFAIYRSFLWISGVTLNPIFLTSFFCISHTTSIPCFNTSLKVWYIICTYSVLFCTLLHAHYFTIPFLACKSRGGSPPGEVLFRDEKYPKISGASAPDPRRAINRPAKTRFGAGKNFEGLPTTVAHPLYSNISSRYTLMQASASAAQSRGAQKSAPVRVADGGARSHRNVW